MTGTPGPGANRSVVMAGATLAWLVVIWALGRGVPTLDALMLGVLLFGLPTLTYAQLPQLGAMAIEREPAYWSSIVTQWLLGGAALLLGSRADGVRALGLVPLSWSSLAGWTAGLTAAVLLVVLAFRSFAGAVGVRESQVLRDLLPTTPRERRVFAVVSVSAGLGEELAYRGYALFVLVPLIGTAPAVAATSVVFGTLHSYQGALGVVRTSVMGGVLAGGVLMSGSLWPAIFAHALVDLITGLVLAERLMVPEPGSGVQETMRPPPPEPDPWT